VVVVNADPRHDLTLFSLESKSEDFHATWPAGEVGAAFVVLTFVIFVAFTSAGYPVVTVASLCEKDPGQSA
jgi:hypothetical protein